MIWRCRTAPLPVVSDAMTRRGRGLVAGMCLAGSLLMGTPDAHAWLGGKHDMKRQVEELESEWRTAQLHGDVLTLDHMLADDYVGITLSGQVVTKPQQLNRIRNRQFTMTRLDLSDMRVRLLGEIAVVTVVAQVEGASEGRSINGEYRYTRVYHHLPTGSWKITNFEATRLRPGSKAAAITVSAGSGKPS